MDEREADAARRAVLSGWLTQGPEVAAFEREFAAAVGALHACAVSSCTTALHLALIAFGVEPGDEVVTVSHSFVATANAIRYCGATPVFVDVELDSSNIDPDRVADAISARTRAILCVHQLGMPCNMAALVPLALSTSLPLIEDAASVAEACRAASDTLIPCWMHESYTTLGYNYRLTDIQAAIGREQLQRLSEMVSRRRELAERYERHLSSLPAVTTPREPAWARTNWQSYAVRLQPPLNRAEVMQRMLDDGVATRRGVLNAHQEPAYPRPTWREAPGGLVHSEQALPPRLSCRCTTR
jgi:dTDP-4-amino-4,6-dideoxygalactose transaminase